MFPGEELGSFLRRKEVIQPHVPVRLPCYDFAPVTEFTLNDLPPLAGLGGPSSGAPGSHGVTCGVYKALERIHRHIADWRLLAIPPSRRRVAACDPNWGRF